MSLEINKVITINFTLKDENGNVLDSTNNDKPFTFISGQNQIIPKLENAINQMVIGSKKNIKLEAEDAYGKYKEDAIQKIDRKEFPQDTEIEVGMRYFANSPDGKQVSFTINDINENDVTVDFNHPLAGKDLEFDIEFLDKRDATPEELSHGHVHGPNGHAH